MGRLREWLSGNQIDEGLKWQKNEMRDDQGGRQKMVDEEEGVEVLDNQSDVEENEFEEEDWRLGGIEEDDDL